MVGEPPARVDYALDVPPPAVSYGLDAPSGVNPVSPGKTRRVKVAGYWWDERPDGTLVWCVECNGPYPAAGVPGMVVVDWNGHKPAAPAVAAPAPFRPGGTPGTSARPAAGQLPSLTTSTPTVRTPTGAYTMGRFGVTGSGCPPAG